MAKKMNLQELSNDCLVGLFEEVVKAWHYDPVGAFEKYFVYDIDEIKEEIKARLNGGR